MDRIGPAGGSPTQTLTNGQQGFVDENLSAGQEGTVVVAEWMNAVQEELMSILSAAGTAPNIANFGQVLASLMKISAKGAQVLGSGTWTVPANVTSVKIRIWGGGGGGGGGGASGGGGGGAAGAYAEHSIVVVPAQTYAVNIGTGGAGGGENAAGSAGGASTFSGNGIDVSAGGGGGGGAGPNGGGSTSFGTATGGDVLLSGQSGQNGFSGAILFGGAGGSAFAFTGGNAAITAPGASSPGNGAQPGGGGGGGVGTSSGAAGGAGLCIVEWN